MRPIGIIVCTALAVATAAAAPACTQATLAAYIEAGQQGCMIGEGPNFTFMGFSFSGQGPLTAADILVTPKLGPNGAETLLFSSSGFSAAAGQSFDYTISYIADPPPPEIIRFDMSLDEDPVTAPGSADVRTTLCIDVDCIRTAVLHAFDNGSTMQFTDGVDISPPTVFLFISNDIKIDGGAAGSGGSASFTGVENITVVNPEPSSVFFVLAGLLGLSVQRMRSKRR